MSEQSAPDLLIGITAHESVCVSYLHIYCFRIKIVRCYYMIVVLQILCKSIDNPKGILP